MSFLLGDLWLRVGDLLVERCLLVLCGAVVLVELTDAVLEVVQLIGELRDLLLLAPTLSALATVAEANRQQTAMAAATDRWKP
jgi:hypothetical protein